MEVKIVKRDIFKKIIAFLLIVVLTMVDFALLGVEVVSYAANELSTGTATNNKNVIFDSYFKDQNGTMTTYKEENILNKDMKLFVKVSVKNEGYFNGTITINESNFKLKNDIRSNGVNKIEGNVVTLNQINSDEAVEIELGIEPIKEDTISIGLLDMNSAISINGIYRNSEEKNIEIIAKREVKLVYTNPYAENEGVEITSKIITNKVYPVNGKNKRVVQVLVESKLKDNEYPVKEDNIEVSVPKEVESVDVIARSTLNSNEKEKIEFDKNDWNYNESEHKVNISIKNNEENGKIKWNKAGKDSVVVTYTLKEDKDIMGTDIISKSSILLYDAKETRKEAISISKVLEEIEGTVTTEIKLEEENINKGKIYSGEDREYKVTDNIYVNEVNTGAKIEASFNETKYETTAGIMPANVQYISSSINKSEIEKILGSEGSLKILAEDGTQIAEINKDTNVDEKGNVYIAYPENIKAIKIDSTEIKEVGKISIDSAKKIKEDGNGREVKKSYISLIESAMGETSKINLIESESKGELVTNKTSLSTLVNNTGTEITALLKTNSEETNLYKNPKIKISLPTQVENIKINSVKLLYEDKLQVQSVEVAEENGEKIILVDLIGEQTEHQIGAVEGTAIIINADLTLNKKATNSNETIKMSCTNQNTNEVINYEQPIQVVSPRGIITINNIEEYGMSSIGEEKTEVSKLELGADAKQSNVNIEVINNNEEKINNVKILGEFPTKNKTNTIQTTVSKLDVSKSNATVYYTEKEDATDDIQDSSNKWSTEITNGSEVKKYLIALDEMEQSEDITASYKLNIPSNLQYNEEAYEGYKVIYNSKSLNEVTSTKLGLATGKGPELNAKMTVKQGNAEIANGKKIAQGEVIRYEIEIENTGSEEATNVKAKGLVPEGTVLVEQIEDYEYKEGYYEEKPEQREVEFEIESIKAGEKLTKNYEVKVTKDARIDSDIENKATVKYGEATIETNTVKNGIKEGNLSIVVKRVTDKKVELYAGSYCNYYAIVENISNEQQKNVQVNINMPEELKLIEVYLVHNAYGDAEDVLREDKELSTKVTLDSLNPGEKKYICFVGEVISLGNISEKEINVSATASSNTSEQINSNIYTDKVKDFKLNISLSANNENESLKSGDIIEYTIKIENTSDVAAKLIEINDVIPKELTVLSVSVDGEEQEETATDNNIRIDYDIDANKIIEAKVKTIVDYDEERREPVVISNTASISNSGTELGKTETISHIIKADSRSANANGGSEGNEELSNMNIISGTAWLDENQNGERESGETLLDGINVRLIDTNGNVVKDETGKELTAVTNNNGFYMINNVSKGEYIIAFEYDTSMYVTTVYQKDQVSESKNSDAMAKQISINGQLATYGVTDTIVMNEDSISNVDIGLLKATKFDLELNKYISKIIVQAGNNTQTYTYNKVTLAKAEIAAKQIKNANVIVEYEIEVKNTGETAGYVKNIVDYMPANLKFSSELNTSWYQSGNNLYNASLANEKLEPGEIKTIPLTLTKTMTEDNTGLFNNTAEIAESYNEAGIPDIDSTPNNKAKGEDDMGVADVIIGVKTGAMVTYISLTLFITALIGLGGYFIGRKLNKNNDIEIDF